MFDQGATVRHLKRRKIEHIHYMYYSICFGHAPQKLKKPEMHSTTYPLKMFKPSSTSIPSLTILCASFGCNPAAQAVTAALRMCLPINQAVVKGSLPKVLESPIYMFRIV